MASTQVLDTLLANTYESQRQFRWTLSIGGISAFLLKTATRPQFAIEDTVIDYVNVKRYVAGKLTWEPLTVVLQAAIEPSAAQQVMEWIRLCYEGTTGQMGLKVGYTKDINLIMLTPDGSPCEEWEIKNAWVQAANFGELDYSVSDLVNITLTIRFDHAELLR